MLAQRASDLGGERPKTSAGDSELVVRRQRVLADRNRVDRNKLRLVSQPLRLDFTGLDELYRAFNGIQDQITATMLQLVIFEEEADLKLLKEACGQLKKVS